MMTTEIFKTFCKGRSLSLPHLDSLLGIEDKELMSAYQSGALPVPDAVSEKIEEIIFSDVAELPASSREEKLDQLLSVLKQLPHKGTAVINRIEQAIQDSQHLEIDVAYLEHDVSFWKAFLQLYEKKCRAEKLYVQGSLFTDAVCYY
ncbi:hypothetical protein AAE02nite_21550 [Adhaeribacter aerolatus]|uniref:Uncharacterized protein n=1 Tax=Adhaeribacter aerolatus TaxID=670289 RepID=A0A512AXP8_9BACT|nr:hypothetical protein [Adhaeribacter aerolatus]GEO04491.1 hypothetical protein AAE02nite_21550 [Adhaeribacter aerolatus]